MIEISKAEASTFATYLSGVLVPLFVKYFGFNIDVTVLSSILMFVIIFISERNPRLKYVDDELLVNNVEEVDDNEDVIDDSGGC